MYNIVHHIHSSRGSALLLGLLILSAVLGVGLGVSSVVVQNISGARGVEFLTISFPAADAGVERALHRIRKDGAFTGSTCQGPGNQDAICDLSAVLSVAPDVSYAVHIYEPGFGDPAVGTCPGTVQNWCIFSTGSFDTIFRSIQVSF